MPTSRAYRIDRNPQGHCAGLTALDPPYPEPNQVLIRVQHSSVNYKDALAGTGRGKILRRFPLTGGIDASGVVEESAHPAFQPGDPVLTTGWGLSFDHDGGYADALCVPGDWLLPRPAGLSSAECMILGTAGLTAALAVHQMLLNGQTPALGPVVVTGASGGVGSIAIAILARLGFEAVAVSGKPERQDWLRALGATCILGRDQLPGGERPLETAVWGGAIDSVGGAMLGQLTRTLVPNGCIASIGLAGGAQLHTTVMPFILRGIKLLGCNSVDIPNALRQPLWQHLASDWRPPLEQLHSATIGLSELPATFEALLAGHIHGRVLVDVARA